VFQLSSGEKLTFIFLFLTYGFLLIGSAIHTKLELETNREIGVLNIVFSASFVLTHEYGDTGRLLVESSIRTINCNS
jgi:cytochrome c biogenesis protein CcdA